MKNSLYTCPRTRRTYNLERARRNVNTMSTMTTERSPHAYVPCIFIAEDEQRRAPSGRVRTKKRNDVPSHANRHPKREGVRVEKASKAAFLVDEEAIHFFTRFACEHLCDVQIVGEKRGNVRNHLHVRCRRVFGREYQHDDPRGHVIK